MYGAQHLSNFAGILSGPVALSSKERRARRTSSGEIYLLRRRLGSEGNSLGTRLALIGSISGRCPQICTARKFARKRACGGGRDEMLISLMGSRKVVVDAGWAL